MGQTASQIESHIEGQREDLSSNLRELERKVKTATDWRYYFDNRPMAFLGVAFGGGMLLGKLFGGSGDGHAHASGSSVGRDYSAPVRASSRPHISEPPSPAMEEVHDTWENIKGALVGIAASRLKEYVDEVVPGFSEQFEQAQEERRAR